MSSASRFLCGVPNSDCEGATVLANQGLGKSCKAHGTSEQAFNCYANYLVKRGYTKIGNREYMAPNDGPITILRKKIRFGGKLRSGKKSEKGGTKSIRFQPCVGQLCKSGMVF